MKIIIPKNFSNKIFERIKETAPNETKGALFAQKINDNLYVVDDVYFEKKVGSFAFVELYNNKIYQQFQRKYHEKHNNDFKNHNYIGDWHSHPSFECYPSGFDQLEVQADLQQSNARFLIQTILKIKDDKLVGNCFLYNDIVNALKIEFEIL